jgi:hypothetical protein
MCISWATHFRHSCFGWLPQLKVFVWHLDFQLRAKDWLVEHGGMGAINLHKYEHLLLMVLVVAIPWLAHDDNGATICCTTQQNIL